MRAISVVTALLSGVLAAAGPPTGWTDHYVLANGIRIHYWRTGGARPVLVMAHGSSDDGLCWTNIAKELSGSYDIVMPDARGHGLSDPPSENDPSDAMVEDLAGLIRELKLVKPILMGHSMGASTVAAFAARYPDVPRAVILEDPGMGVRPPGAAAPGAAAGTPESRRAALLARNNLSEAELVAQCMKGSPKWGLSECEIWAPSKRRHHPDTVFRRPGGVPMSEILPGITAPTLILKADAQGELRQQNEKTAALLPKGRIVHIDGAGHNVRRENKEMALRVLREFLAGL